jgi:hypothetical protein
MNKLHSISDAITNSSTEIFACPSKEAIRIAEELFANIFGKKLKMEFRLIDNCYIKHIADELIETIISYWDVKEIHIFFKEIGFESANLDYNDDDHKQLEILLEKIEPQDLYNRIRIIVDKTDYLTRLLQYFELNIYSEDDPTVNYYNKIKEMFDIIEAE